MLLRQRRDGANRQAISSLSLTTIVLKGFFLQWNTGAVTSCLALPCRPPTRAAMGLPPTQPQEVPLEMGTLPLPALWPETLRHHQASACTRLLSPKSCVQPVCWPALPGVHPRVLSLL